jgi:hypothetical protein
MVAMGKGDLMLCPSCDAKLRRLFDEDNAQKSAGAELLPLLQ